MTHGHLHSFLHTPTDTAALAAHAYRVAFRAHLLAFAWTFQIVSVTAVEAPRSVLLSG